MKIKNKWFYVASVWNGLGEIKGTVQAKTEIEAKRIVKSINLSVDSIALTPIK